MSAAIINIRFWLAKKLVGKHATAINCGMGNLPSGFMAWSFDGSARFATKGDPR